MKIKNNCLNICVIQKNVLSLQYKIQGYMKRLNDKEKDLIEAIRNFRKARSRIEQEKRVQMANLQDS